MADPTQIPLSPQAQAALQAQAETIRILRASGLLPQVSIGDVIKLAVRQNNLDGTGLIFWNGALMKAALPPDAKQGDKLVTRLMEAGDQIVLKILSKETPGAAQGTPSREAPVLTGGIPIPIADESDIPIPAGREVPLPRPAVLAVAQVVEGLEKLLRSVPAPSPSPAHAAPVNLNESLRAAQQLGENIDKLVKALSSPEQLADPHAVLTQLLSAADGKFSSSLRAGAQILREIIDRLPKALPPQELPALPQEFRELKALLLQNREPTFELLNQVFLRVETALKHGRTLAAPEREVLEHARRRIETRTNPELVEAKATITRLLTENPPKPEEAKEVQIRTELERLAVRLDQMANTQDTMNRLNPLMQSMGEPAIILFPFLFQGMLFQSEVTVNNYLTGKKKGGKKQAKEKGNQETFQRIQIAVPLPGLGPVGVDLAIRTGEILLRLTVESDEAKDFLEDRFDELRQILADSGFTKNELASEVGPVEPPDVAWREQLYSKTSIVV